MIPTTNFTLVAFGFLSVSVGVVLYRSKSLRIVLFSLGALLFVTPFALHWYLTRDAYEWKVVVERATDADERPPAVYLERIEWITDYAALKRQRGHIGSAVLRADTVRKEWGAKGYVPLQIRAEVLYGSLNTTITRNFRDMEPGSYVFTLHIREDNVLTWSVEPYGEDSGSR